MHTDSIAQLADIDALERSGDVVGALDAAVRANRAEPSLDLQRLLVDLRERAASVHRSTPRSPWPLDLADPFPDLPGDAVPEIPASELTSELMGAAILHHGSLLVRGLFDAERVERTAGSIIGAVDSALAEPADRNPGCFEPRRGAGRRTSILRAEVLDQHGVWLADSPRALAQVLDDLDEVGVIAAVGEHFAERPVISLEKSTLRRSQPTFRYAAWHQDGSFLGPAARALNVWVALSPCGGDRPTPGLELVSGRVPRILPRDGVGNASIDGMEVHVFAQMEGLSVTRPLFDPGDALLFDELMAHRTHLREGMTEERLALECWFFAPSNPAENYGFLLV